MARRGRVISAVGSNMVLVAVGSLFTVVAVGWAITMVADGRRVTSTLLVFLLTGGPWLLVLYGGHRLPRTGLRPDVYPRIVAWCLGGIGVLLAILGLVQITSASGLDRPVFSVLLAAGIGGVSGLGIGANEARSVSRAREAERHRDELRRERDLRERIVQTSPIGIAIINADGSVRMVNERTAQIVGLSVDELEGIDDANDPAFQSTDAEGNAVEEGLFQEVLRTGDPTYDVERQITRADGERIWISVNAAPLGGSSEDVASAIVTFQDITEDKRLEQELKETVEKLQTSNERLEESNERLEESNERLEQFAYATSHDLQEPLRMVSSYLQLIESRYGDELDDDGREYLNFAVDGADRMRNMIAGLLQYSRIDTEGNPFEPIDLEAVFGDVRSDLQMKIEERDADIVVGDLPIVQGDEEQLRQVFQNLLDNAIEYSGDDTPRVRVSAEQAGDTWVISVSDEGVGIDPKQSDRVFEVFQRLHNQSEHTGMGIGLAICERIVERHGGDIWVDSEPGNGSTFCFTLHRAGTQLEPAP